MSVTGSVFFFWSAPFIWSERFIWSEPFSRRDQHHHPADMDGLNAPHGPYF
jgi:hypothetical protein